MGFGDTSLALPPALKEKLKSLKRIPEETYASVLRRLIEDSEKGPLLEKDITRLETGIIEMSSELGDLKIENEELKKKLTELETKLKEMEK